MRLRILRDIWGYIEWFYDTKIHFLQLHYIYIFLLSFISSAVFYFQPKTNWNYIDALFMGTTATTNTGLNTITMSDLTKWQLTAMYLSSFLGSHIMVSIIILYVRRHYFSKRFEDILIFNKAQRLRESNRRKFEKNMQEMEKQRRKSISGGDLEKSTQKPLRRRLSFMSVRSSPPMNNDDEENALPTFHPKSDDSKKPRPLSHASSGGGGGLSDLLHHFKKRTSRDDFSAIEPSTKSINAIDNEEEEGEEDSHHPISKPRPILNTTTQSDIDTISNTSMPHESRIDSDASLPTHNRGSRLSTQSYTTHPLSSYPRNSLTLTNTTETILSKTSSRNSNRASTNKNTQCVDSGMDTDDNQSNNGNANGQQGIAFAENIERQREIARRRLEQDRKFEDILQRIAGDTNNESITMNNDSASNTLDNGGTMMMESDDEEMKRIMREPIHKSELTRQQRYRLGGAEYRAIVFLTRLVPIYYLFCSFGFGFFIRIYVAASSYAQQILRTSNANGPVNEWLFSFFLSMSSFNNLGLSIIDASMVPFQSAPGLLVPVMFLILAGNTAYAIFLRLIIWIMYKLTPKSYVMRRETFRYLLDHPRRCYTTLFPATQTKWLLIVLVGITAIEFICFLSLNYWLPVLEGIDWGARVLDGLFQSVATRNAGFSVVDLMTLNPGTQIVFIVAMYISVYPVAISMRNSNVYQERALGIYSGQDDDDGEFEPISNNGSNFIHKLKRSATLTSVMTTSKKVLRKPDFFVMTQIQRQLTSEICWVICCIFAICVIEAEAIMSTSPITMSSVIYECVSAFGNVGASTGFPGTSASQAQQYHTLSKLVLIILMYRGRHRGLPAAIDRAVLLPSEQLEEKEQQDHLLRRRNTSISVADGNGEPVMFYNRSVTL